MPFDPTFDVLLVTTVTIAFLHTVVGVDHSLPFVVLARARGWSLGRTMAITAACGLGHVLSSVLLGAFGIALGVAAERLAIIESFRGNVAAWLLIAFGLLYALRSVLRRAREKTHVHEHVHADGTVHAHSHEHTESEHRHAHAHASATTFWALFIVFVLGPCEALIPLLMAPAALHDVASIAVVAVAFGVVTIATMLMVVALGHVGMQHLRLSFLERHADTLAGCAIAASGLAIVALGV